MRDAWKQKFDLEERFSTSTQVRQDIVVTALACERGVELTLFGEKHPHSLLRSYKSTGKRNVTTMRELAKALNDACDFVDYCNPKWAKGHE